MRLTLSLLLTFTTCMLNAQQFTNERLCDSLLLDAQYKEVINTVDKLARQDSAGESFIRLQSKKAEALIRMGNFDDAEKLLTSLLKKLPDGQGFDRGVTLTTLGLLNMNKGRNDLAVEHLNEALRNFESEGRTSTLEGAQALAHLAIAFKATGKVTEAEERLQLALTYRRDLLPETHELIAASYNDLGFVFTDVDNDKALEYYDMAMAIYEKLHGKEHPKIAIANTNIGYIYRNLELYGDAIVNFETALEIWEKVYPDAHPTKAFTLQNLGLTYSSMSNLESALGYYDRALDIYKKSYGAKHPDIGSVYNVIGNIKNSQEKYDEALAYYQKAMIANIAEFENEDIEVNPGGTSFYNGNVLLYSMMYKAQALENKYLGKTLKMPNLELSLQTLQSCDTLIDKLRQQTTNESDKIALGVIANEVYGDGVRISTLLAQVAFKKEPYRIMAFYFAEKSKSAVLLDAISDTDAKSYANIPPETLEEEQNLKTALALINQKLAQKPSEDEEKYLREAALMMNNSYVDFVKQLESKYPEYYNLKFNQASPSIGQLQQHLDNKTAILSYFIDEKNNRLYTFLITRKKYKLLSAALGEQYDGYLSAFRNSLYYMEMNLFTQTSTYLSKLLIPRSIPKSISDIVIIPTGRMSVIPFEALLTKKPRSSQQTFGKVPYLIRKYSVRYEFSAGLALQKKQNESDGAITSAMLCAPIKFPQKFNLVDLPGTESEIQTISTLFGKKNINNKILLNDEASEAAVKMSSLKDYDIIHFATHGIVDEAHPELSRIYLQTESEAEDGSLYTSEIYNLQLNARLVTLSACQTGLGKISKGEGVIGLSRALIYAGADRIIVSFWSVADESTVKLMTDFYGLLLDEGRNNYSQQLRKAKLDMINSEFAAPYYWAPFILIGF